MNETRVPEYRPFTPSGESSGFNMGDTIKWYKENHPFLTRRLNARLSTLPLPKETPLPLVPDDAPLPLVTGEYPHLSHEDLRKLYRLFPNPARKRSAVGEIKLEKTLWFHRESTSEEPKPTDRIEEALSETAIIPGHTTYSRREDRELTATVHLNTIPDVTDVNESVARLIAAEAFVHEMVHPLIAKLLYPPGIFFAPSNRTNY